MVQIKILDIVGKNRGDFMKRLRKLHLLWADPSNDYGPYFCVSFGKFLFANPAFVTVFKNSGTSEVVRVSSFFIMKFTRPISSSQTNIVIASTPQST